MVNPPAINWPFGQRPEEQHSDDAQAILDNAMTYASMGSHLEVARLLLDRGATINTFPLGFHYRGTALHWAAFRGLRSMCEFLVEHGADASLLDLTVQKTPAGWADYGKNQELAVYLSSCVD